MHILETKNYNMFKTFKGNRAVNALQVERLKNAIKQKNLLVYRPIIVNNRMEVIDGQHRLEAARELNIPIPYLVNATADYRDATILNANADNWDLSEYLGMYVEQGYSQYVKLKNFLNRNSIELEKGLLLLSNKCRSPDFNRSFKEGRFTFDINEALLDEVIIKIKSAVSYIKSKSIGVQLRYLSTKTFWKAMYKFIVEDHVDWVGFMNKLEYRCDLLRPMSQIEDYIKALRHIYNYKRKSGRLG